MQPTSSGGTPTTEQHTVQIEHAYCRAGSLIDGLMAYRDFGHLPHGIENVGAGELFIVEIEAVEHLSGSPGIQFGADLEQRMPFDQKEPGSTCSTACRSSGPKSSRSVAR